MSPTEVHIGADPEFVILDENGKSVPAHSLKIPRKADRVVVQGLGSYIRDGYALELNPTPSYCRGSFNTYLRSLLQYVDRRHEITARGYSIVARATVKPRRSVLKNAPEDVQHFGCDPSEDAYSGNKKVVSIDAQTYPYRHMGGHLHFGGMPSKEKGGWPAIYDPKNHPLLAKMLDLYVGVPSTVLFDHKREFLRRAVYGQAGEYRPQDYGNGWVGFEYRTPSPEIFNHPALVTLFTGVGRRVIVNFAKYKKEWDPDIEDSLRIAINTGKDVVKLLQTVDEFYTPETILLLKNVQEIHKFQLHTYTHDPEHQGWTETARKVWNIPVPGF